MKNLLSTLSVLLLLITGCTNESETTSTEILGEWELTKEIFNKQTLSYTDNPIKTILSFKEEGYFHLYDDVSEANLGDEIGNIQTHYKGQYVYENETIQLTHDVDGTELTQKFDIQKISATELILKDNKHQKELHYSKL